MHRRLVASSAAALVLAGLGVLGTAPTTLPAAAAASSPARDAHLTRSTQAVRVARAVRSVRSARAVQADGVQDPLTVTLDQLSPAVIPARGQIELSGTVTNADDATWTTIKVYPFISDSPMTTQAQLAAADRTDPSDVLGQRIDVEGTHNATIATLAPGETADFSFSVPRGLLDATTPGVYWFGVQALGQGPSGRDNLADGRALSLLPLVPQRTSTTLPVSVVLPLRRPVEYADDGSLADPASWLQTLSSGGRLRSLVDLGSSAAGESVSWLVDPAVVDAVRRLAAGNPARSLAADLTPGTGSDPDETAGPSPTAGAGGGPGAPSSGQPSSRPSGRPSSQSGSPSGSQSPSGTDGEPRPLTQTQLTRVDPGTRALAEAAQDWLSRLSAAVHPGDEVLVLPYGDTDVSGAAANAPQVYRIARARADAAVVVPGLTGVRVVPAVGAPSGYLSQQALELVRGATTLTTDRMYADPPAALAQVDGGDLVVTSSFAASTGSTGSAAGGAGDAGGASGTTALRQHLLAEAAVRILSGDAQPLVSVLPRDVDPQVASAFFDGLAQVSWVQLRTVADATAGSVPTSVTTGSLHYPRRQQAAELGADTFAGATRLMAAGSSLQSLLTLNNLISGSVRDEALTTVSYAARTHPEASLAADERSRAWIAARADRVTVSAPTSVNLLSSNGRFNTTIRNGLDEPVTVALAARTDGGLQVTGPRRVRVPAHGIASVPLAATTDESGVHQVMLQLTDQQGVALGGSARLAVRSSQVSGIIWLFLAIGAALLFGTIALRLVRRVRGGRADARPARPTSGSSPDRRPEPKPAGAGRP